MGGYVSKFAMLKGTSYGEVSVVARKHFNAIRSQTRRQPYVRSRFFNGDKVFITIFWDHLAQKHQKERTKRLKFYAAALDTIRNTMIGPEVVVGEGRQKYIYYRFYAKTKEGVEFCVQIRQGRKSERRDFMSVFARKFDTK